MGVPEEHLEKSPFDLSGGQKRRVAIAGVIAMEPDVLILDEPTAGLDPQGRDSILENIRAYQKAKNATVMMVSHAMEEVARVTDRLLVMDHGGLRMDNSPREVFRHAWELQQNRLGHPPGDPGISCAFGSMGVTSGLQRVHRGAGRPGSCSA